jgi:uroporphyrinogen III methyltransferase/synthase
VDILALYETVPEPLSQDELAAAGSADYVTFTSSSTVRYFFDSLEAAGGTLSADTRVVSIGPVTSESLRAQGLEPDVESSQHDVEGLIEALVADARAARR